MGITGTQCIPRDTSASQRKKWLAGGGVATGSIKVDKGAEVALQNCKSLLAVGVEKIILPFEKGDVIEIRGASKLPIGVAIAKISSMELESKLKEKNLEVANVDGIVIL
jgi:glutamate 5-kinase